MEFRQVAAACAVVACLSAAYAQDKADTKGPEKKADKTVSKDADSTGSKSSASASEMKTLPDGTKYQDLQVGSGKEAKSGNRVMVHYTGTLESGKVFDSSKTRNQPFQFSLGAGEVIKGWDVGVAGMKEGGKRKLVIPPSSGYGPGGAPPVIPPNATLNFEVELLKVM